MNNRATAFYEMMVADGHLDAHHGFEGGLPALLEPYAELLAEIEGKLSRSEVAGLLTFGIALRQVAFREVLSGIDARRPSRPCRRPGNSPENIGQERLSRRAFQVEVYDAT